MSDDFDDESVSRKNQIVTAIAAAAANWEAIVDVDFRYVPEEDDDCDAQNTDVWFNVRPSGRRDTWSYAFFPSASRSSREVRIGELSGGAPLMTHELGHVLGFRHEFERPEFNGCKLNASYRVLSPYDGASVMHYPSNASCGDNSTYTITRSDTLGAQRIFGGR